LFVFGLFWLKNGYLPQTFKLPVLFLCSLVFFPVPKKTENLRRDRQNLSEALCEKLSRFSNLPLFENHLQNSQNALNTPSLCSPKFR
jgi:hypothetical protein